MSVRDPDSLETESRNGEHTGAAEPGANGLDAPMSRIEVDAGSDPEIEKIPLHTKSPLAEMWFVAWPTVLTMTSYTVMQFIDAWMVSLVGPTELAAQGNGGIYAFAPLAFAMGMLTIVNTFVSQNLGAGHPERGSKYAWNALWLAFVFWLCLIPYGLALPSIFNALHPNANPTLIELESIYGRILIFGSILTMSARAIGNYFFGLHRPKIVFVATIIGNAANVFANWVLIFGHLGFPEMGVAGAAWGTLFGTAIELIIPITIFLGPKLNREMKTRSAWRPDWLTMWDLFRVGWPRSITFGNEILCWSIFMVVLLGTFGEEHITAGWITLRYMHLSFMPAVGISVAVTAVVGRYIGAGEPDTANHRAYLGVKMAVTYMGFCALCFVLFRETLVSIFVHADDPAVAEEIISIGSKTLICAAVFQMFDAMAIAFSGALTGAGDTVWPGFANVLSAWTFIIGGGWLFVTFLPQLESLGPWIGGALFIIVLGIALFLRWRAGGWRKIKLVDRDGG